MSTSKQARESQTQIIKWFGAGFLIMIGIIIGSIVNRPSNPQATTTNNKITPIYTNAVMDIASEFICACGSCEEPNLVACSCETAIQEKSMIKELLNKGSDRAEVVKTIEAMFGGRKKT